MNFSFRHYNTKALIMTILGLAFSIDIVFDFLQSIFFQNFNLIVRAPANTAFIAALLHFYDRHFWKYPILNKLVQIPDLSGRYSGFIEYEWEKNPEKMKSVIEIIQTASTIKINTFFKSDKHENTQSTSWVEDLKFENGHYFIHFFYFNSGTLINGHLNCHYGANRLKVILDDKGLPKKLSGNYFTNRNPQTKGKIEVKFESRKLKYEL